ncbi:MAG: 16S rRNA (cytosine(1402)-N(4))-methyltransferase RsmH [Bacteroidales bacterium]|nr:16S rRNA (cytosine(1402)-N(4))-methyltransferase RsmH [Bacteroidales bacterium]
MYHNPVMVNESLEGLSISKKGVYVDATYGSGGHSAALLEILGVEGKLVAFDQDPDAIQNKIDDERLLLINHNFRYLRNFLKLFGYTEVDGVLADLGVSSHQIDDPERGFSTRFDSDLDMRMNPTGKITAKKIINGYSQFQLTEVFRNYGELNNARFIAERIIETRSDKPIERTSELRDIVLPYTRKGQENKFLARIFQALRIEINDEIEALKDLLQQAASMLSKGGRLVVVSYHSLEDRLVKNFMKTGNFEGILKKDFYGNPETQLKMITRKPMTPSENELKSNPRSRSAKLRIAEKIEA